ncbi:MAG: hypothetical protein L3J39_17545 [Verrucomicrobiales bacterium]|nr:hypothetical protein [Verrucomicrobiales bacterium]
MSEQVEKGRRRFNKKVVLIGLGLLLAGVVPILMIPAYEGIQHVSGPTRELNQVVQLILACRTFAADYDGAFPIKLKDLYPDYIDQKDFFEAYDANRRNLGALIYFPGKSDSSFSRSILLAYPVAIDNSRIVGFVGGQVTSMKEKEYQRRIAEDKNDN